MLSAAVEPLSASSLVTSWSFDPVALLLSIVAAGAYVAGVRRLARRHRRWSRARSFSFGAGIVVLLVATQSVVAAYDTELFSMHVGQHVLIGILAPLLFALGAPITLALQASRRPTQVNLLRVLHSKPMRVIGHPIVAWVLFGATLFVLYFSSIYELSLRNGVAHAWVHIHFLVVGCLFCWATVGLDPVPHRVPYGARIMLVLFMVPFHAFLGLALMSTNTPLAAGWYASVAQVWKPDALDDQRIGAGVMWLVGDVTGLVLGAIVAGQWLKAEARKARHVDRVLDERDRAAERQRAADAEHAGTAVV